MGVRRLSLALARSLVSRNRAVTEPGLAREERRGRARAAVAADAVVPNRCPRGGGVEQVDRHAPPRDVSLVEPNASAVAAPSMRSASRSTSPCRRLAADFSPARRSSGDARGRPARAPARLRVGFFVFDANDAVWLPPPPRRRRGAPVCCRRCGSRAVVRAGAGPLVGLLPLARHPLGRYADAAEPRLAILLSDLPRLAGRDVEVDRLVGARVSAPEAARLAVVAARVFDERHRLLPRPPPAPRAVLPLPAGADLVAVVTGAGRRAVRRLARAPRTRRASSASLRPAGPPPA